MIIVQEGDKIGIWMDPTELNKNNERRHYPMIKVSQRTSQYLVIATLWGRYKYLRMPFEVSCEVFSQFMTDILSGVEGCEVAMDDIFIYAETKEELAVRKGDETIDRSWIHVES